MNPPKVGDPITVLDETGKLLVHARWGEHRDAFQSFVDSYHTYRFSMAGRVAGPDVTLADEGVTWCRGHVNTKHKLGKALLVSAALAPEHRLSATDEAFIAAGSLIALGVKYALKRLRERGKSER